LQLVDLLRELGALAVGRKLQLLLDELLSLLLNEPLLPLRLLPREAAAASQSPGAMSEEEGESPSSCCCTESAAGARAANGSTRNVKQYRSIRSWRSNDSAGSSATKIHCRLPVMAAEERPAVTPKTQRERPTSE